MNRGKPLSGADLQDLGLYLMGLVQLMAADRNLDAAQRDRIRAYAIEQGFDGRFVEDAMDTVLENEHFPSMPPRFQSATTAMTFLSDAARLALCDGVLHPREEMWLFEAARHNGIDPATVVEALFDVREAGDAPTEPNL
jgi:hypothetical protein